MNDIQYSKVKIKEDRQTKIPEFRGTDFEVYGPFDPGEKAVVPFDNADLLVMREEAEWISREVDK